jgi:hypothetical protein
VSNDDRVLPDQTEDDTDAGWNEPVADDDDDDRFLDDVPPHHVDRD